MHSSVPSIGENKNTKKRLGLLNNAILKHWCACHSSHFQVSISPRHGDLGQGGDLTPPLELHRVTGTNPDPSLQPSGQGQPWNMQVLGSDWRDPIFKRPARAPLADSLQSRQTNALLPLLFPFPCPPQYPNLGHITTQWSQWSQMAPG